MNEFEEEKTTAENLAGEKQDSGVSARPPWKRIISKIRGNPRLMAGLGVILVVVIAAAIWYWQDVQRKIYIEKSEIWAPVISLSPKNPGEIDVFYVKEGDFVEEGQNLVKVGGQIVTAKTSGLIIWIANTPGQYANAQTIVVKMIDPRSLRVVGHIQENKGLNSIRPGQKVKFTVDAFDGKQYSGVVENVGNMAREGSIVFSISDKREEKEFDVNVIFDFNAYPELKDGMSAKMWIYK